MWDMGSNLVPSSTPNFPKGYARGGVVDTPLPEGKGILDAIVPIRATEGQMLSGHVWVSVAEILWVELGDT